MGVNKVFLLGNLGADPELRYSQSQTAVCSLRIATGERRKSASGEWVDHTEWHSVVTFGNQAENCGKYLAKGRQVFVEGRLQTNKWQDQEGKDRYRTEIIANNVQFVGGRGDAPSGFSPNAESQFSGSQGNASFAQAGAAATPAAKVESVSFDDDDIPF